MRVKVTQKHIDKGVKGSFRFCPLALALRDHFPQAKYNQIEVNNLYAEVLGWDYKIYRGSRFIERFDAGKPVKPFTAELRPS